MIKLNHISKALIAAIAVLTLASCANSGPAPVLDLTQYKPDHQALDAQVSAKADFQAYSGDSGLHIVRPGETLYSIAWRYSLDHRELAKNNNIKSSTIYPGQKLSLLEQSGSSETSLNDAMPFSSGNLLAAINKEVLNKPIISSDSLKRLQAASQQRAIEPPPRATKRHVASNSRKLTRPAKTTKVAIAEQSKPVERWIWPVNGKVVGRFSATSNMNKGLDIVAKKGSPVRATAEGRVVYSGNGLRGYGQLVIIKHNEQFLSAYAHNKKIHVEENEVVKAGQRIAELGDTGSDTDKLHFEIRLKGKPVDPLNYLPKSGLM